MPDDRTDDGACGADDITHIYDRQVFKNLRFQMTDNTWPIRWHCGSLYHLNYGADAGSLNYLAYAAVVIDLETHRTVFSWLLGLLADRGLIQGKRVGVDACWRPVRPCDR
jgi:hypothetical protein